LQLHEYGQSSPAVSTGADASLACATDSSKQKDIKVTASYSGATKPLEELDKPNCVDAKQWICSPLNDGNIIDSNNNFEPDKLPEFYTDDPSRYATPDLPSKSASVIISSDEDDSPSNVEDAMPSSEIKTVFLLTKDETGAGDSVTMQIRSPSGWAGWPKLLDGDATDVVRGSQDECTRGNGEGCLEGECCLFERK
jgi:hypothetical protein